MQTSYAKRLRRARQHAGLSQAELARRAGLKPQAVNYLEEESNNARGSRHTPRFASECGVDALWLESDTGQMLPPGVRESEPAPYHVTTPAAMAAAIGALRPELRQALTQIVLALGPATGPRRIPLMPEERAGRELNVKRGSTRARRSA